MCLIKKIILPSSLVLLVACGGGGSATESTELIIRPDGNGWGSVNPADAKAVALSSGHEVLKNIPGVALRPIILRNKISGAPITLFQKGSHGEYIIGVDIGGTYWSQLAYQFSHELTHIISNYDNTKNDPNQWFEEAICEAASIQAIKNMSLSWRTNPPYPNWTSYSSSLADYYASLITENNRYLSNGDSLASWYQREKNSLRSDPIQRNKNEIVGTKIFHFFNESPERWRSVKYLNIGDVNGNVSLRQYLGEWRKALPHDLKYVAETISSWFGY